MFGIIEVRSPLSLTILPPPQPLFLLFVVEHFRLASCKIQRASQLHPPVPSHSRAIYAFCLDMDCLIWYHLPDHVFMGIGGVYPDEHSDPWYFVSDVI